MGHKDIKATTRYLHVSPKRLPAATNPLEGIPVSGPARLQRSRKITQTGMNRPTVEVADLLRTQGDRFVAENRSWLSFQQLKVLRAIRCCRTPALGGHLDQCSGCDHSAISFNSCRSRHCPNLWMGGSPTRMKPTTQCASPLVPGTSTPAMARLPYVGEVLTHPANPFLFFGRQR